MSDKKTLADHPYSEEPIAAHHEPQPWPWIITAIALIAAIVAASWLF
jgi:hypothetical protein